MKLCIISDTHSRHHLIKELPNADVIIHCGDISNIGGEYEIYNFFYWFSNLIQFEYKIMIAGNHDFLFEKNKSLVLSMKPNNVIYLEDSEVIINNTKFYGTPVSKIFNNWAFNRDNKKLQKHWEAIPDDVDVLITHEPPYGILDLGVSNKHIGSISLYNEVVNRIKPKLHCFGHAHNSYGKIIKNDITFINSSILDSLYYIKKNHK